MVKLGDSVLYFSYRGLCAAVVVKVMENEVVNLSYFEQDCVGLVFVDNVHKGPGLGHWHTHEMISENEKAST